MEATTSVKPPPPPPPSHGLYFPTTQRSLVRSRGEAVVTLHNLHTCLLPLNFKTTSAEKCLFRLFVIWKSLKPIRRGMNGLISLLFWIILVITVSILGKIGERYYGMYTYIVSAMEFWQVSTYFSQIFPRALVTWWPIRNIMKIWKIFILIKIRRGN